MLPGERSREFVLGYDQEAKYLASCRSPLKEFSTLILDTGLRRSEALSLLWTDIVLDGGKPYLSVKAKHSKNSTPRAVPLTARVLKLLTTIRSQAIDEWVFSSVGKAYSASYMDHVHQEVRDKLKLDKEFVIHGLRHTFGTRLGESGADAFTIMKLMGHSSITISQRYVHPSTESARRAIERLGSLLGSQDDET